MVARAGVSLVALLAIVSLDALVADAGAGVVAGKIEGPQVGPEPPVRGRAFLPRLENPHAPVRTVDPLPAMVVVLEPAAGVVLPPIAASGGSRPSVMMWDLLGDSFARPLVAARLGQPIEIRNLGRGAPVLVARGQPSLLAKKPLNPTDRVAIEPTQPGLLELADETTPHLRGRALIVATSLVAIPDAGGRFELPDVPAGDWTVRVYYAPLAPAASAAAPAGWIDRVDDKITVGAKRVDVPPIKLPPGLPVKAPSGSAAGLGPDTAPAGSAAGLRPDPSANPPAPPPAKP